DLLQTAIAVVEQGQQKHNNKRPGEQADRRNDGARQATVALADDDGQIDDIWPRQELTKAELGIELLSRHPPALFDQHAPSEGKDATEAGKSDR
ncbi:MAG: hypothetical protein H6R16_1499, partial [Proteobacteria bacterium]|nr:hypothetical protein [Pseudomonadota bacterium]